MMLGQIAQKSARAFDVLVHRSRFGRQAVPGRLRGQMFGPGFQMFAAQTVGRGHAVMGFQPVQKIAAVIGARAHGVTALAQRARVSQMRCQPVSKCFHNSFSG